MSMTLKGVDACGMFTKDDGTCSDDASQAFLKLKKIQFFLKNIKPSFIFLKISS